MIIKLRKKLHTYPSDYIVTSENGTPICKISKVKGGYYLYNKLGEQIAQVTFSGSRARLGIAHGPSLNLSTIITMIVCAPDKFDFFHDTSAKEDQPYLAGIKGALKNRFSIWGKTTEYSYDIYDNNALAATVTPIGFEPENYSIRMENNSNILQIIMIAISADKLNDPKAKI